MSRADQLKKYLQQQYRGRFQKQFRNCRLSPLRHSPVSNLVVTVDTPELCRKLFGVENCIEAHDFEYQCTCTLEYLSHLDIAVRSVSVDLQAQMLYFPIDISIFGDATFWNGGKKAEQTRLQNFFMLSIAPDSTRKNSFSDPVMMLRDVRFELQPDCLLSTIADAQDLLVEPQELLHSAPQVRNQFLEWIQVCRALSELACPEAMYAAITHVLEDASEVERRLELLQQMLCNCRQLSSDADTALCLLYETGCLPISKSIHQNSAARLPKTTRI